MKTRQGQGTHLKLAAPTGEPLIDLLACAWQEAFELAQASDPNIHIPARAEIITFFGRARCAQLRAQQIIPWDPDAVPVQAKMEV